MNPQSRAQIEQRVRELAVGDERRATAAALDLYGPEVFGFLMGILGDEDAAQDVFQHFSVDLWRGLAGFQWRSSLRTWCYRLARSAASRHLRSPARRIRQLDDRDGEQIEAHWTRTATAQWRKTEAKNRLWAICDGLETDDRAVLVMRIGRGMSWKEIATVMATEPNSEGDDKALGRRAATLRKRFERIKLKVREEMNA